jgi:metal-responsive CopG/Arc/MetJ family transcriptional regulator
MSSPPYGKRKLIRVQTNLPTPIYEALKDIETMEDRDRSEILRDAFIEYARRAGYLVKED